MSYLFRLYSLSWGIGIGMYVSRGAPLYEAGKSPWFYFVILVAFHWIARIVAFVRLTRNASPAKRGRFDLHPWTEAKYRARRGTARIMGPIGMFLGPLLLIVTGQLIPAAVIGVFGYLLWRGEKMPIM